MTPELEAWLRADQPRCLALTLHGEGRSEPIWGRIAIGTSIRNRVKAGYRGGSFAEVCLWPSQYSCWKPAQGPDNYAHVTAVATALMNGVAPPWTEVERLIFVETTWIANGIVSGVIRDYTKGSRHYMTERQFLTDPKWAEGVEPACRIGSHCFFVNLR